MFLDRNEWPTSRAFGDFSSLKLAWIWFISDFAIVSRSCSGTMRMDTLARTHAGITVVSDRVVSW